MSSRDIELSKNLSIVQNMISGVKSTHKAKDITLVAVSKTKPLEDIQYLQKYHNIFGENYAQEFAEKFEKIEKKPEFHFIGALQSNKASLVVGKAELIHSVDRLSLAKEIDKSAKKLDIVQKILIQLNLTGETTKSGITENEIEMFLDSLRDLKNISVVGLMTMPFFTDDGELVRPYFRRLREIRDDLKQKGFSLNHLSMGMSGDFIVAIEEGATIVRVGSLIFGER
ncbi:YggS family pyridoxal phosphate-dependent enzyme [bacterium]|nr:YggS family pyridoxal phosphate-dependent enzyme [bacterium]